MSRTPPPDLTMELLPPEEEPAGRWCASGHVAPPFFRRDGAASAAEPTRFLRVTGQGLNGVYCEPCVVVANGMKRARQRAAAMQLQNVGGKNHAHH